MGRLGAGFVPLIGLAWLAGAAAGQESVGPEPAVASALRAPQPVPGPTPPAGFTAAGAEAPARGAPSNSDEAPGIAGDPPGPAADDQARRAVGTGASESSAAPRGRLDLAVSGERLDLSVPAPAPDAVSAAAALGLEPTRASAGTGAVRMPQLADPRKPGLYFGVVTCEPGGPVLYSVRADDPGSLPEGPMRGLPPPRGPFIPGRPIR